MSPNLLKSTLTLEVKKGYETAISVEAVMFGSSSDFAQMSFEKRQCYLEGVDSKSPAFDDEYPYDDVMCKVEKAYRATITVCQCTLWSLFFDPWYSRIKSKETKICDFFGTICFHEQWKNQTIQAKGFKECYPRCDDVYYTGRIKQQKSLETTSRFSLNQTTDITEFLLYKYIFDPKSLLNRSFVNYLMHDQVSKPQEFLKKRLNQIAIVHFNFDSAFVTKVTKDAKVTTADYLSNIGGTLGLCTGFSIISLAEVIYWGLMVVLALGNNRR